MDIKQMITGEEPTEETVHITTEDEDNYEEEEKGFNDQVKATLMIEDMALGCWVENNVDLSESDNEEEFFDPNEPNEGNNEDVLQEDERSHMSRDAIP